MNLPCKFSLRFIHGLYSNGTNDFLSQQKISKFSTFLEKIFNSHFYVSVDNNSINNFGRYFTCGICNFETSGKTVKMQL